MKLFSMKLVLCFGVGLFVQTAAAALSRTGVPYASCFSASALKHNVPGDLLMAVVATESNWDPNARSHANAHGLMQIQWPGTARHLGVRRISQLYEPCRNIDLGAGYLRELLDRYDNNLTRALAAYNYGPGRIGMDKPIPAGARRYVSTIKRHRGLLGDQAKPAARSAAKNSVATTGLVQNKADRALLVLSSRVRARRYVRLLNKRVKGAAFSFDKSGKGQYQIWMAMKPTGLSGDDKLVLSSLGWSS
jgi:soluble lytic murein transglycosylase-like protein